MKQTRYNLFLFVILLSFSIFLIFWRLGNNYLVNWDEAWIGAVVKDSVINSKPLDYHWLGTPWFYEPPLVLYMIYSLFTFMGINELSARLFVALTGLLTIVCVFLLARTLKMNSISASISSLLLISNIEFLFRSRRVNMEIPLGFLCTLIILLLLIAKRHRKALWLASIAFSLALLTKRIEALLLLPVIILILFQIKNKFKFRGVLYFIIKTAMFGLVVLLPWHIYSYIQYGNYFINEYLNGYIIGKITSINPTIGYNPLFYVNSLYHSEKIWFIFLVLSLPLLFKYFKKDLTLQIGLIWLLSFVMPLSIAPIKASWYIIPAYPAIAILIGWFIDHVYFNLNLHKHIKYYWVGIFVLILSIMQLWKYRDSYLVPETVKDEVVLSKYVSKILRPDDIILLDDDYLPVATFYTDLKVIPLRFDYRAESLIKNTEISKYLKQSKGYVLTNTQTIKQLLISIGNPSYTIVHSSGNRLLIRMDTYINENS